MGQCEQVLQYIKDFGSINRHRHFWTWVATDWERGYMISGTSMGIQSGKQLSSAKNRYGKAVSYAEYRLEDNNAQ